MNFKSFAFLLPAAAFLAACGEPLTKSEVIQKYSGHTVSKLTFEQRYQHLGPNDPSLGQRYIFHRSNGSAYYAKATNKGYKRREAGRWWAGEDKICYSMRVTRSEDPEGDQCAPAGTDVAWSTFERGDTKGLAPKRSTARRGGNSDIGFGYDKVLTGLAVLAAGAVAIGAVSEKVCGPGGCQGASAPSGETSTQRTKPSSPTVSGQKSKRFNCIVYCKPGDRELKMKVSASNAREAEEYLKGRSLHKTCTAAGYSGVGGGFASDGVYCRQ